MNKILYIIICLVFISCCGEPKDSAELRPLGEISCFSGEKIVYSSTISPERSWHTRISSSEGCFRFIDFVTGQHKVACGNCIVTYYKNRDKSRKGEEQ
jgi:hypothetical protein